MYSKFSNGEKSFEKSRGSSEQHFKELKEIMDKFVDEPEGHETERVELLLAYLREVGKIEEGSSIVMTSALIEAICDAISEELGVDHSFSGEVITGQLTIH